MFQLVLNAKHQLTEFGLIAPYATVFLLYSQTDCEIDVRTMWQPHASDAPQEMPEDSTRVQIQARSTYLRRSNCRLPMAPGTYDLTLDWRPINGVWQRAEARFPVTFEERVT